MKVGGIKTWKELTIGAQLLVRLLFNNNLINPGQHSPYLSIFKMRLTRNRRRLFYVLFEF